ncbi:MULTISPECIES: hypothetical protein [unclassified Bradyrhizobium]|uniref:hypothetical protein n=1 Tax=unclassified Bradyrhizobium TaxID=2631580 RepID=UPI002916B8C1|nr:MULTISPECIES: hypothetical protein [unclassified Bradyrhizobium]
MVRSPRAPLVKSTRLPRSHPLRTSQRRGSGPNLSEAGFHGETTLTLSSHFTNMVAAIIAVGTLSLCVSVTIAVLTIKASLSSPT